MGKGRDKLGWFEWGGCSDNVWWVSYFFWMFIDVREWRVCDVCVLMNFYNNCVGRWVSIFYDINFKDVNYDIVIFYEL